MNIITNGLGNAKTVTLTDCHCKRCHCKRLVLYLLIHLDEELLVLRLEGEREPVDDGAEDLEELADAIEVLSFVDEPGKK